MTTYFSSLPFPFLTSTNGHDLPLWTQAGRQPGQLQGVGQNDFHFIRDTTMTKSLIVAAVLSAFAVGSFAQAASSADAASAPAKKAAHKKHHKADKKAEAAAPAASAAK